MNKEVMIKWAEALESGKYQQAKKKLRIDENSFCCLGVLCELYREEKQLGKWEYIQEFRFSGGNLAFYAFIHPYQDTTIESANYPLAPVEKWVDLPRETLAQFAVLNDDQNLPFTEIAKYIRSYCNE